MTGHVLAPIVKSDAPRIRAVIRAETGQPVRTRFVTEPAAVGLPNGSIGRFHLSVVKDRLSKDQVSVGRPGEVVQRMVRIFRAESAEYHPSQVGFAVVVGVFDKRQVRHFRDVDAAVAEFERKRYV